MVKLLLENRSPVNATDVAGYTPLHHGESHFFHETEWVVLVWLLWRCPKRFLRTLTRKPTNFKGTQAYLCFLYFAAISEGHGDTALALLKAGAETDKKDVDGHLAIELAPDSKVRYTPILLLLSIPTCFCYNLPP